MATKGIGALSERGAHDSRHTGEIAPGAKGVVASGAVLVGGEAVTAKLEVVVDAAMGEEEALRMAG
jgi:hypothetical protein